MKVERLVLGDLDTICYIISKDEKCLIIDPASDADVIKKVCNAYKVVGILVTHHHFDHIGALEELEKYYNIKHNIHNNSFYYEVINTPGHTNDSISFYFKNDKVMFTGDFIFYQSIGRCDFENSDINDMKSSLDLLMNFDDDIKIYPGHGESTILRYEKKLFDLYKKTL